MPRRLGETGFIKRAGYWEAWMLKQVQHDGGSDLTLDALMPNCAELSSMDPTARPDWGGLESKWIGKLFREN
jgi:hypothetical protein